MRIAIKLFSRYASLRSPLINQPFLILFHINTARGKSRVDKRAAAYRAVVVVIYFHLLTNSNFRKKKINHNAHFSRTLRVDSIILSANSRPSSANKIPRSLPKLSLIVLTDAETAFFHSFELVTIFTTGFLARFIIIFIYIK